MTGGLNEHPLHTLSVAAGVVTIKKKRIIDDIISWSNDGILPERQMSNGEIRKKEVKVTGTGDWADFKRVLRENASLLTNYRSKQAGIMQARCPSCEEHNKDRDDNHFFIIESHGGFGCLSSCSNADIVKALIARIPALALSISGQEDLSRLPDSGDDDSVNPSEPQLDTSPVSAPDEASPGKRLVKKTDHHVVQHVLLDSAHPEIFVYEHVETSKTTGKETRTEKGVNRADVQSLWSAIVRHILPKPVIGATFDVGDLWDTMNIDRTKQGEKYTRWNFPSDILILLGVIEKNGNTYTVRRPFR